jgi:hypothetical protein
MPVATVTTSPAISPNGTGSRRNEPLGATEVGPSSTPHIRNTNRFRLWRPRRWSHGRAIVKYLLHPAPYAPMSASAVARSSGAAWAVPISFGPAALSCDGARRAVSQTEWERVVVSSLVIRAATGIRPAPEVPFGLISEHRSTKSFNSAALAQKTYGVQISPAVASNTAALS